MLWNAPQAIPSRLKNSVQALPTSAKESCLGWRSLQSLFARPADPIPGTTPAIARTFFKSFFFLLTPPPLYF